MPAIVLTSHPSVSTAVQSLHLAVVVEYLIKPVTTMELLRCVGPAVATGRFWRRAFQAYDEMTVRSDAIVSLKRHGASNGSTRGKAGQAEEVEHPLQQRGSESEPRVEQRQETPDARQLGSAGQVTGGALCGTVRSWWHTKKAYTRLLQSSRKPRPFLSLKIWRYYGRSWRHC
jgi:hypothetical protein